MSDFNVRGYWEKRLQDSFNLRGVGYKRMGVSYNKWMYNVRRQIFNKSIGRLNMKWSQNDVLDIGSGTGYYIDLWKELGVANISGCDITEVAVSELNGKYRDSSFYIQDISDCLTDELAQNKYHSISAFDVLFHIVDDERFKKALENIYTLLLPGGYFILSDNFIHAETKRGTHHVNRSVYEFEFVLSEVGFKVMSRIPSFYLMNEPVDTDSDFLKRFWNFQLRIVSRGDWLGNILGLILYPLELLILNFVKEGPSTELMICRKK